MILQILTDARALIERPESWCQGAFATDGAGNPYPGEERERRWCMAGAIFKVDPTNGSNAEWAVMKALDMQSIRTFNDDPATTHADVLSAFDAAIEKARADG